MMKRITERGGPLLLSLLLLGFCPLGAPCPDLCTCYRAPLTVSCQSQGFTRVPGPLPRDGARIFLQNNRIGELSGRPFPPAVAILWLYSNNITAIRPGVLRNLGQLEELDLGENRNLRSLDQDTFSGLVKLRTLHLHRCGLTVLADSLFRKLYTLQYLYLQDNDIPYLQSDLFLDLENLSYLFLHGNRIRVLSANAFRGLVNLDRLLLHHNRIGLVQRPAFRHLLKLATLFLFNNSLAELPGAALGPLASLQFLRLNDNPWACDCRARSLWQWFQAFRGASSSVTCSAPEARRGRDLRLLTSEDFRACPPSPDPGQSRPGAKWAPAEGGEGPAIGPDRGAPREEANSPGNVTSATRLNDSPGKEKTEADYWPDYYYEGDLTSSNPQRCSGQGCWRNAASTVAMRAVFGIALFPIWGLALLQHL